MHRRLPQRVVVVLGCVAVLSFAVSMYLENYQLEYLQRHPISVNLISGVVGFSVGLLVIGLGFNWLATRDLQTVFIRAGGLIDGALECAHDVAKHTSVEVRGNRAELVRITKTSRACAIEVLKGVRQLSDVGLTIPTEVDVALGELRSAAAKLDFFLKIQERRKADGVVNFIIVTTLEANELPPSVEVIPGLIETIRHGLVKEMLRWIEPISMLPGQRAES